MLYVYVLPKRALYMLYVNIHTYIYDIYHTYLKTYMYICIYAI